VNLGYEIRKKFNPDPGGKKAPDPGSGSATLVMTTDFIKYRYCTLGIKEARLTLRGIHEL
jgi:hypothetical protein